MPTTKKGKSSFFKKLTKSPLLLIGAIVAVAVLIYLAINSNSNQQGTGQPSTNPNSLGSSSAGGYYLLTEEVTSPPVNVSVTTGSHVNRQRHHLTRAPSSHHTHPRTGATGREGSNPNVIAKNRIPQHEGSDRWFINRFGNPVGRGHHVTHIAAPTGVAPHSGIGQNQRVVRHAAPQAVIGQGGRQHAFGSHRENIQRARRIGRTQHSVTTNTGRMLGIHTVPNMRPKGLRVG